MNQSQLGAWGEHLVVAELLQRSFYVATPVVDIDGYDILSGNTPNLYHRIQVKSCRQPTKCNKSAKLAYRFFRTRHESDFHILCCLMHRSFYVVPTLDMPTSIILSGDGSGGSNWEKYLEAFHLLSNETSKKV